VKPRNQKPKGISNTVVIYGNREEIQVILDALKSSGFSWYSTNTYHQCANLDRFSFYLRSLACPGECQTKD
jgi:hypothetical protein